MDTMKYYEYFDINETYYPCIDESAINSGIDWMATYPHETFIKLLKTAENMLGGATKRSIWIHGAYGTGKSRCAYALKKILEVPETELREYWNKYAALRKETTLLEKFLGHKEKKIVTALRYASGSIDSPQQLFLAIQESVKYVLESENVKYKGEKTLKESVMDWMEMPAQKAFVDSLLQKPEWSSLFTQSSADEIVNSLRKNVNITSLMDNIFRMASKEGITALSLDADRLRSWIKDVINENGVKIVLVWDEFSDFFRLNRNSLGEFQKIVSICEEAPFYLIVVTHPITSLTSNDDSWKVLQDRFDRIEIELPENIAFELIGDAFKVKEAVKGQWNAMVKSLESSLPNSINAVMRASNVSDREIIKNILPLQPMAALVLKNIANAFQSNQRSMFDFIKSAHDDDVKAFQWFIHNYGPYDDEPVLTVDMLWDFFYVKGREYLTSDIKLILDTFQQQTMLTEKEKKVLKAVLIMQAIDQRLGGSIPVLKPTDQNLSYAFEGISEYEGSAKNIAKSLETKGVLISNPIGEGKKAYGAAVLAGDSAKIEQKKKELRNKCTTADLVQVGAKLAMSLNLTPALKLRFARDIESGALLIATITDFKKIVDALKNKDISWRFYAVLCLAKTEEEAQSFRILIKRCVADEAYKNIIIIDALSSPLGIEAFEQYIDYAAMTDYYQGNNNQQARENSVKALAVLERDWRDRIHDGQFYVYTYANQDGEKAMGANNVHAILQMIVLNKFRFIQDFTKGLTESQLKLTQTKPIARYGIVGGEINGLIKGCEKSVLGPFWNRAEYWLAPELQTASIVVVKKAVDKLINEAFDKYGKISIGDVYDYLQDTFGFSPSNLSAFITGFLLKEYSGDPYRCINSDGYPEPMTPEKLSEMIGNYIGKTPKPTYIVKMTQEEKAFYNATEQAWGVPATSCSSPGQVCSLINNRMRELLYPVWCLQEVDNGVFDIVKKYIALIQSDGKDTHNIAIEIGKIVIQKPSIPQSLQELMTPDKCKEGITLFLSHFDEGKLFALAKEIGAENLLLGDIQKIFSVKHSALWIEETGKSEIQKLFTEYKVIECSNEILNVAFNSKEKMFNAWRDELKFIGFSCEALQAKHPELELVLSLLLKIVRKEEILPETMKVFLNELIDKRKSIQDILNNSLSVFKELYGVYLEGFSELEIEEIKNSIGSELFTSTVTASNQCVKQAAENYRKNQLKTRLFSKWKEFTGTKNPREWSSRYQTPILCLVDATQYEMAKNAFITLNSSIQTDTDIRLALEYLETNADFFEKINDRRLIDSAFTEHIIGKYVVLLTDINRVRESLDALPIDAYDWYDSPAIKQKIQQLADAEYMAGGSDRALNIIDSMSDAEVKTKLKDLVKRDVEIGVKIISNGGK